MSDDYTVSDLSGFNGERLKVGVGYAFSGESAAFDDGEIRVEVGDVVVFDDPDAGMHAGEDRDIINDVFVGFVKKLYAVNYDWEDGFSVEVGTTAPLGRLSVDDSHTAIIAEDGKVGGGPADARDMASRLVDGDYEKYVRYTSHIKHDPEITGE